MQTPIFTPMLTPMFTLMVQGTTSDAGKSTLVAGLGRVLANRQHNVVPFKPQNMALNSAVTPDGGEIGRAQALQAQACLVAPHVDMNPILIKPSSDTGAQIIVSGKPLSNMDAQAFHAYKPKALTHVVNAYKRLQARSDIVLVEGAGSPAEINLREGDIANMGFAEAVDCPVIIIADIDKGGVFAHLVGTLDLLSPSEQNRVIGFVINRFRGDIALLQSGLDWLEARTQKPVLGVIPYLHGLYLDAEDAIDAKQPPQAQTVLKICVVVLPRISNHTDFDSLRLHPQVDLEYVHSEHALPPCDLLIIPGSKNTRSDCQHILQHGWLAQIKKHLRYGGKVVGICGGYQILGASITDNDGIEDAPGTTKALGIIPMHTTLLPHKQLINVSARLCLNVQSLLSESPEFHNTGSHITDLHSLDSQNLNSHNLDSHNLDSQNPNAKNQESEEASPNYIEINGYEIHCGISTINGHYTAPITHKQPLDSQNKTLTSNTIVDNKEGYLSPDNQIFGTYLHGIFDNPKANQALLTWAGLKAAQSVDINAIRETQLNRLANTYEEHLNLTALDQAITAFYNKKTNHVK